MTNSPQPTVHNSPDNLRLEWRDPAELKGNPANWRRHPDSQKSALKDVLGKVGWAGVLLYNEQTQRLIDGHCRKEIATAGERVPVLIGSWTPEQERLILATLDPIASLATPDPEALRSLIDDLDTNSAALDSLIEDLASSLPATTGTEVADYTAGLNAIISYTLIFDNEQQQSQWFDFVKRCRATYPADTIAASVMRFLQEHPV